MVTVTLSRRMSLSIFNTGLQFAVVMCCQCGSFSIHCCQPKGLYNKERPHWIVLLVQLVLVDDDVDEALLPRPRHYYQNTAIVTVSSSSLHRLPLGWDISPGF